MAGRLKIVWDGSVPGLAEHRLSIEAFGPSLQLLLPTIRRVASDIEMKARGPRSGRGRLAREAAVLDLQIVTLSINSPVTLTVDVVPTADARHPLIDDLPDRAVEMFLADIKREASSIPAHHQVRRFLKSLPAGLTSQTYEHRSATGQITRVELGEVALPSLRTSPYLLQVDGLVAGATFEPARPDIRVRTNLGELVSFAAPLPEVERAVSVRHEPIVVMGVRDDQRNRLLRMGSSPLTCMSADARKTWIFSQWDELLTRLSK